MLLATKEKQEQKLNSKYSSTNTTQPSRDVASFNEVTRGVHVEYPVHVLVSCPARVHLPARNSLVNFLGLILQKW